MYEHEFLKAFEEKVERPLRIAVVGGAGYVGTVTAAGLAHLGHHVVAVDVHGERVAQLRQGICPFLEVGLPELIQRALATGRLTFTESLSEGVTNAQVIFVAVNTPRRDNGEADLSRIIDVAAGLGRSLGAYTVIVVKSTVPVGSHLTIRRVLEQFGRREGDDYDLVANPEFLREGNAVYDFFHPDRIVIGGHSSDAIGIVRQLLAPLQAPVLETSIVNAQTIKYAANAFLAMRISFVNEVANICEHLGADIGAVTQGLGFDPRIGSHYLKPGVGFSGPCLPKDLESLIRLAEDAGYEPNFLKAIFEKNEHQRRQILAKVCTLLGVPLYGRRIGVLGVTFKPGTSDVRNSSVPLMVDHLVRRGAEVCSYDPGAGADADIPGRVMRTAYEAVAEADLLLVATAWDEFSRLDYQEIRQQMRSPRIVDAVNLLDPATMRSLGFAYLSVGRP